MVKNLLITLVITLFSVLQLYAQSDEQAFEELKKALIEAIETKSDTSLEIYKLTLEDMLELSESLPEDLREQQKTLIEESGGMEVALKTSEEYFQKEFEKLKSEAVQSLNVEDFLYHHKTGVASELPEMKALGMKIYSLDEDFKIEVELIKLQRGWVMVAFEVTSPTENIPK